MKFGVRKPSIKKSIKASTTGRAKRAIKSSINPLYGKKGMGLVNDPKKAIYNKVYNKTTVSAMPKGSNRKNNNNTNSKDSSEGSLLAIIWVISFVVILFNGKPLLNKFISFLAIAFLSTVVVTVIKAKLKDGKSNNTTKPRNISNIDNNIYEDEASLYLKQINESINIINTTKNPDTFFSRRRFLLERLDQLINISSKVNYTGENPVDYLKEFQENKTSSFNDFIDRYYEEVLLKINNLKTEKAKLNNANKFYENLMKYEDQLEDNNMANADILYLKLKDHIDKC